MHARTKYMGRSVEPAGENASTGEARIACSLPTEHPGPEAQHFLPPEKTMSAAPGEASGDTFASGRVEVFERTGGWCSPQGSCNDSNVTVDRGLGVDGAS